jgi:hypothetical protein
LALEGTGRLERGQTLRLNIWAEVVMPASTGAFWRSAIDLLGAETRQWTAAGFNLTS